MKIQRNHKGRLTFAQWRILTFAPLVPFLLLAGPILFVLGARGLLFSRGIWLVLGAVVLMVCGIIFRRAIFYWGIPVQSCDVNAKATLLGYQFTDMEGEAMKFDRSFVPYRFMPQSKSVKLYYIKEGEKRILLNIEEKR